MNFFSNLRIGTRLAIGFAVILGFSILATAVGLKELHIVSEATRTMMEKPLAKERLAADWYRNVFAAVRRTTAIAKSSDDSLGTFFKDDTAATAKSSTEIQKAFETHLVTPEEKDIYQKIGVSRAKYVIARDAAIKEKLSGNAAESLRILEKEYLPHSREYENLLLDLLSLQRKAIDDNAREIQASYQRGFKVMVLLSALLIAFGIVCAFLISRSITKPLGVAVAVARRVADNDLTANIVVTSKDESGQLLQALKDMNEGLSATVNQVRLGVESISTASSQIAAGNLDLSSRTEQQASSLEETAASIEELTSTVKQNAENAFQANQMAMAASGVAVKGGAVVSQVVTTMGSIDASARKIADIISTIDGIAFQTNILALNAAVEAARAGEQGRGFAVVATEVRNLAQRSASAAKEIKELIGDSVEKVDAGTRLVAEAGATMTEIVTSIQRVTDLMTDITSATQEQSAGIGQVNQAIGQMDQVTQQNAALVEEAAAAAESLQDQATRLAGLVSVFKLDRVQSSVAVLKAVPVRAAGQPSRPALRKPTPAPARTVRAKLAMAGAGAGESGEWKEF